MGNAVAILAIFAVTVLSGLARAAWQTRHYGAWVVCAGGATVIGVGLGVWVWWQERRDRTGGATGARGDR